MIQLIRKIFRREYRFLNRIELNKNRLISNYQYLSSLSPELKIAPVLKSNAYGHGLIEVAKILEQVHAPFFCVDSLHEAYHLYKSKIKTPVLIMGYFDPENLKVKKLPFAYAIWDLKTADIVNKYQKGACVHIKVDTGMNRLGVPTQEIDSFCKSLNKFKNIRVEGLMSHFASASGLNDPLYKNQIANYQKALNILNENNIEPQWRHIAASQAILNDKIRDQILTVCNLARAGRATYGILSDKKGKQLKPVLKLTTRIAQIKNFPKGDRVGYDGTYTAPKDLIMGVLPIGYFDGVDRRLSNKGVVSVGGVICPIIGRVSMNITTVDLTSHPNAKIGQTVVIYSDDPDVPNSINNSASLCDTIPHELLIHLVHSTKRVVV